jgi:hypothetical protein
MYATSASSVRPPKVKQALAPDVRRPKKERRTVRALHEELKAAGYTGGYTRLTDYVRELRAQQGSVSTRGAYVPLAFALGEAFQFDWSEEGLVIGGHLPQAAGGAHEAVRQPRVLAGGVPEPRP